MTDDGNPQHRCASCDTPGSLCVVIEMKTDSRCCSDCDAKWGHPRPGRIAVRYQTPRVTASPPN